MKHALIIAVLSAAPLAQAAVCEPIARDLAFGSYTSSRPAPTDAVTTVSINCTAAGVAEIVTYSIAIGPSLEGGYQPRAMRGEGGVLEYNLYVDPARSLILGDGTQGTATLDGQLSLPGQGVKEFVVFGRIPARQSLRPGTYADMLTVAVEF
jgi:spore coat protein U-like protein